jgi:hypothetical protein
VTLRSGLCALAFLLAGAILIIFAGLCAVVFLADRDCGPTFGYYGCPTPTASISKEDSRTQEEIARVRPR